MIEVHFFNQNIANSTIGESSWWIDFFFHHEYNTSLTFTTFSRIRLVLGRPDLPRCKSFITDFSFYFLIIFLTPVLLTRLSKVFLKFIWHSQIVWSFTIRSLMNFLLLADRRLILTSFEVVKNEGSQFYNKFHSAIWQKWHLLHVNVPFKASYFEWYWSNFYAIYLFRAIANLNVFLFLNHPVYNKAVKNVHIQCICSFTNVHI